MEIRSRPYDTTWDNSIFKSKFHTEYPSRCLWRTKEETVSQEVQDKQDSHKPVESTAVCVQNRKIMQYIYRLEWPLEWSSHDNQWEEEARSTWLPCSKDSRLWWGGKDRSPVGEREEGCRISRHLALFISPSVHSAVCTGSEAGEMVVLLL